MYTLGASSRGRAFTDFLPRRQDKFGVTEKSRSASVHSGLLADFTRAHALFSYKKK